MTELQPLDTNNNSQQLNGGVLPPPPPSTSAEAPAGSKRLRRPSVRLGEIGGDQYHSHHQAAYDSQGRKPRWTPTSNRKDVSKPSRTRTLTNLGSGYENSGTLDEDRAGNVDSFGVGTWRVKRRAGSTTAAKRVRSNWVSKIGDGSGGEELEGGGFRDFSRQDSESRSPIKEENCDTRRHESNNSSGNREPSNVVGVKVWLEELGLGRYWPMFEIHEVDHQVLPFLTLEDLKDMGISAVGSRRKMFSAIHKLVRE